RRCFDFAVGGRVNVVPIDADEGVGFPGDVAVAVEDVLPVLVVVVGVGLSHVLGGRGGGWEQDIVAARGAGVDVGGDSEPGAHRVGPPGLVGRSDHAFVRVH